MIRYSLKCDVGHNFDAWFRDSSAYDTLKTQNQVTCAVCGSSDVDKTIMAPSVAAGKRGEVLPPEPKPSPQEPFLSAPASKAEAMLRKLAAHVRATSDYVGKDFAQEARRIHSGESDERPIWGEATVADAKELHDEGVPVAPLPRITPHDD